MVVVNGKTIVVLSVNCQGLRTFSKRTDVINYLKDKNPDILCLQDTHWLPEDQPEIRHLWGGECIVHGNKTNSRGVAILFGNNFQYKIEGIEKDDKGNMLSLNLKIDDLGLKLINVYGPNKDSPLFYDSINRIITSSNQSYTLICGDFNLVLDPKKDSQSYRHINNPNARNIVLKMIEDCSLTDVYRYFHPDKSRYTWRRKPPTTSKIRLFFGFQYYVGFNTSV